MSASLSTENFQLPYFASSDYTSWAAYNESVNKIDTILKSQETNDESLGNEINAIQNSITVLTDAVQTDQQQITKNTDSINNLKSNITLINQIDIEQNQKIHDLEMSMSQINGIQWHPISITTMEPEISNYAGVPPIVKHLQTLSGIYSRDNPGANNILKAMGSFRINSTTNIPDYIGFKLDGLREQPSWEIVNANMNASSIITQKNSACEIGAFRSSNKVIPETVISIYNDYSIQFFAQINSAQINNILTQQSQFFQSPIIINIFINLEYTYTS